MRGKKRNELLLNSPVSNVCALPRDPQWEDDGPGDPLPDQGEDVGAVASGHGGRLQERVRGRLERELAGQGPLSTLGG